MAGETTGKNTTRKRTRGAGAKKSGGAKRTPAKAQTTRASASPQQISSLIKETVRDVWYAGLGALSLSEEKVREVLNSLVEKGKLSEREATKFFNDFRKRMEKNRKELEKWLDERIKQTLSTVKIPSVEELRKEVQQRLKKLEEVVEKLRSGAGSQKKK